MPGWSTEIAEEFVRLAAADGAAFSQVHLQELVYIAHGWCLALTGQPLTGDRPEAMEHGPEYRRLANALVRSGIRAVTRVEIVGAALSETKLDAVSVDANFHPDELAIVAQVYTHYGHLRPSELAQLTRADDTPWARVYAGGSGKGRDISHTMIRDQFAEIAAKPVG